MAAKTRQVERAIAAPAKAVFDTIVDVRSLPEWNERIRVGADAANPQAVGDQWVVEMGLMGVGFRSRSEVLEIDATAGRLVHRSQRDDGNPSYTIWTWVVTPDGDDRCRVSLGWELVPRTPTRRVMAAVRARMIPDEAAASLAALDARCTDVDRH
jgi:uncharacterized protein YndB with AHSA1/START domain